MAVIDIDAVSDELVERLRQMAARKKTDMKVQALSCLVRGLGELEQIEAELAELRAIRAQTTGAGITDDFIRAAREEGRA